MPEEFKEKVLNNMIAANVLALRNANDIYTKLEYLKDLQKLTCKLVEELNKEKELIEKNA